jgi:hypothetical protein
MKDKKKKEKPQKSTEGFNQKPVHVLFDVDQEH